MVCLAGLQHGPPLAGAPPGQCLAEKMTSEGQQITGRAQITGRISQLAAVRAVPVQPVLGAELSKPEASHGVQQMKLAVAGLAASLDEQFPGLNAVSSRLITAET
jgi:hypothetical protein